MNRRNDNVLWGGALIIAGIIFGGKVLGLWDFNLFFAGWWSFFIIIPSAVGLFQKGNRWNSIAGITIGVMLLVSAQEWISWRQFGQLVVPTLLVIFGLQLIFGGRHEHHPSHRVKEDSDDQEEKHMHYNDNYDYSNNKNYFAVFSGQEFTYPPRAFTGANILCVLSGVELDLRKAIITEDVTINCQVILGGAEIYLPPNVNVEVSNVPILGGVSVTFVGTNQENAPTVYVNAVCVLGGIDIK